MSFDPFGGRTPTTSRQAPFDNCLTIQPDDDKELPVIASALLIPMWTKDEEGQPIANGYAARPNAIVLETQNGETLELHVPALNDMQATAPILLPVRPRKILKTGTTLHSITLLW